ncbi:uncharacterized protein LOC104426646 [Eucalyptus grandis]|uniref:uncharacterized protein LOC104426646 n=1 Tax=Eucalyptus grandis TaxID=71139 RepID=UPI00192E99FF|nr:uncharacterized protein LOC104426646 [Eucalyptus grandis]
MLPKQNLKTRRGSFRGDHRSLYILAPSLTVSLSLSLSISTVLCSCRTTLIRPSFQITKNPPTRRPPKPTRHLSLSLYLSISLARCQTLGSLPVRRPIGHVREALPQRRPLLRLRLRLRRRRRRQPALLPRPRLPELRRHLRTALASPSAPPPPPPGILTLSSPGAEDSGQERIGNFLERCCYCQKTIRESDEVFMYGHLRAFCTADCREKQVAMDKLREKRPVESKNVRGGHTVG